MLTKSEWAVREIGRAFEAGADEYCSREGQAALWAVRRFLRHFQEENGLESGQEAMIQLGEIVGKLIEGLPLTPITDAPEEWRHFFDDDDEDGRTFGCYQSIRYPSLFQYRYEDGEVVYSDVDRLVVRDVDEFGTPVNSYADGEVTDTLDGIEPITMPYTPEKDKYIIYIRNIHYGDGLQTKVIVKIEKDGVKMKVDDVYSIQEPDSFE